MEDWMYAQTQPQDKLTKLHHFTMVKIQGEQEIEFNISVRETVLGGDQTVRFFAQTDKFTNQKTAPYLPSGWGSVLLDALSACVQEIQRFPYEGEELE